MINFSKAFYIKLGTEGCWSKDCFDNDVIRIGWKDIPRKLIEDRNWTEIHNEIIKYAKNKGSATRDLNALKNIIEADKNTIFVTFENSHLYWIKVSANIKVEEDKISKYIKVGSQWKSEDINGNPLYLNKLPGSILKTQRFSGTICKLYEIEKLQRIINVKYSAIYTELISRRVALCKTIEDGLKELHWKDFELLIDLIFRETGWQRVSVLGENMKYSDLELKDLLTQDMYQVQIKSKTNAKEFKNYTDEFDAESFRKLFYIYHSSDDQLSCVDYDKECIELISPKEVSELVMKYGLVDWIIDKCT
jgi:hypothetical protein